MFLWSQKRSPFLGRHSPNQRLNTLPIVDRRPALLPGSQCLRSVGDTDLSVRRLDRWGEIAPSLDQPLNFVLNLLRGGLSRISVKKRCVGTLGQVTNQLSGS